MPANDARLEQEHQNLLQNELYGLLQDDDLGRI